MPTIIESLLVTLGLDSREFVSGKGEVDNALKQTGTEVDKTADKLKKIGKAGADGFENIAKSAVKFLSVIGSALAVQQFVERTIESSAALERLSKNLNVNADTVSAWSNAAELAGGSAAGLQGSLDMISRAQTEILLTGQSGMIPYLSALGISLFDAAGKARSTDTILLELADKFSKMERPLANNMGRMLGIDQGTMQLLLKGRAEVERTIASQKNFGAVSKQQAEEASVLSRAITESKQRFEAFGRELLSDATPALEAVFAALSAFGEWLHDNKEFVETFLTILTAGLIGLAVAITPINLAIMAVMGLVAALALLWQDYKTFKEGGETLIPWDKWEPGVTAATKALTFIKDLLIDMLVRAIAVGSALLSLSTGDFSGAKDLGKIALFGIPGVGLQSGKPPVDTPTGKPPVDTPTGDKEKAAMSYFQSQGWVKDHAAGLTSGIKNESNFDPNAIGDNGAAYGIGQWHPPRQDDFKKRYGKPIQGSSFEEQLAFMNYELTEGKEQSAGRILKGTSGAKEAGEAVSKFYARPKKREEEAEKRGRTAVDIIGGTPGASQAAVGAGASQTAPAPTAGASIVENRNVETHIGEVNVYSSATNAEGIVGDIDKSIRNYLFTSQSNYGLN